VVATQADLEELAVASMSIFGEGEGEAREHVSKAIGSESRLQFRAILGGSLIGMCCLTREDGATWITGLGILPSLRGKGLGAELLDAAIALALARWGEAAIRLEVKGDNAAALALYRSRGFVELGAIEYYRMAL
jgi:ribosomal protein S18 acetylase RimI-like enzyme